MELIKEIVTKKLFTLMAAPVAKGKTRSILKLYDESLSRMVFVSPLKALALEVKNKFANEKNIYLLGEKNSSLSDRDKCINFLTKKKAMLITTVEKLEDEFLEILKTDEIPILFILDEFHLFYTWGEGFRPILHDKFLGILNTEHPVIGLSATINEDNLQKIKRDLSFYHPHWVFLDFGNQELFRKPHETRVFKGHDKNVLNRAFIRELKNKKSEEVFLYFCSYRQEVDEKVMWARKNGYRALGCVGGEVQTFQTVLEESKGEIDCIFSTIALSHGVNLPEISKVFINYEVKNFDFWLQMIGRGGRLGSNYEVYTFDSFAETKWEVVKEFLKIKIEDVFNLEL